MIASTRGIRRTSRGGNARATRDCPNQSLDCYGDTEDPRGNSNHRQADDGGEAMELVRRARQHLVELTGHEAGSVSGIERDNGGPARIRLEVVELERIPRTTDILATYELTLDDDGRLVDCTRVGRYSRSSAEAGVG